MSAAKQFYECTISLIQVLEKSMDRDEKIVKVEALLDQRQQCMERISKPLSIEDNDYIQKSIILNKKLDDLLIKEKISIQKDMKELKTKKASSNKYTNPYQNLSTDGMFYDKRN